MSIQRNQRNTKSMLVSELKRRLRPVKRRLQGMVDQIDLFVRPPIPWNGHHHPAFQAFRPWHGRVDGRFIIDFLGIHTDPRFRAQFKPHFPGPLETTYPPLDYTYFELVSLLQSVLDSVECGYPQYSIMELGAGYGLWIVTAYKAVRQLSSKPVRLIGVEMEPTRFQWMHEHLRNNSIDPAEHQLIHAAVSATDGKAMFHPRLPPDIDYGLGLTHVYPSGMPTPQAPATGEVVECVSLVKLLHQAPTTLDLLHFDVQGEEWPILRGTVAQLQQQVRRVIIATHSSQNHRRILSLFDRQNWKCEWNFRPGKRERTDLGDVRFLDGLLVFANVELCCGSGKP